MIISLSGYMGAGKTAIGRELARLMQWDFIDLDDFITAHFGETPAQMIRKYGERALRIAENQALNELLTERDRVIIALGGGSLTEAFNRRLTDQYTFRVFIDTPWKKILMHLKNASADRPLWNGNSREQKQHYEQRLPAYGAAHLIFRNDYPDARSAAKALWQELQKQINLSA